MNYTVFKPMNETVTLITLCVLFHRHLITITGVGRVQGLAVDPGEGKLYFSNDNGNIEVANINGSEEKTFISHPASTEPMAVAVDLTAG